MVTSVIQDDVSHWLSPLSGYGVNPIYFFWERGKIYFLRQLCDWLTVYGDRGIKHKISAREDQVIGRILGVSLWFVVSVCSLGSGEGECSLCMVTAREQPRNQDNQSSLLCHLQLSGVVAWTFVVGWLFLTPHTLLGKRSPPSVQASQSRSCWNVPVEQTWQDPDGALGCAC